MSWSKYDDEMPVNRKVAWLKAHGVYGVAALGLHMLANCWSRHEGQQGFIPDYMPGQLVGRGHGKMVALLVEIDMFLAVEHGWMINDYDEYGDRDDGTPVDEKLARLSKVRAEAGRRGGLAKAKQAGSKPPSKRGSKAGGLPDKSNDASNNQTDTSRRQTIDHAASDSGRQDSRSAAMRPGTTGLASGNGASKPLAKGQQTSSPVPVPTNSPTSPGSRNAPAGFAPRIVRAYCESARDAGLPAPEESQARVERSARSLLTQGYDAAAIEDAARNAALGGWTDLATQLQRDASRASPATNGTASTADQRFQAGIDLADHLERKALP